MAFPPINIFSQNHDPEGTLARLVELVPDAKVTRHADGTWAQAQLSFKRGWLKKPLTMQATHDPDYYSGEGWSQQLAGMQGYFGSFPNASERPDLFDYLPGLQFAFNFMFDGDPEDEDPRMAVVFEMAGHVDGVLFLPGRLLDSSGRIILTADGENDPDAELPKSSGRSVDDRVETILKAMESGNEDTPANPPAQETVINRFLLICSLVQHGFMEQGIEAETYRQEKVAWLKNSGIWEEAEPWEAEALETSVADLSEKLKWKLPWLSEGASVLAWALQLADLPAYDQEVEVAALLEIANAVENGQATPSLRPLSEMETLSFQMLAIHWRIRQFYLDKKAMDFVAFAPTAWCGPMDLSLARLMNNDLELHGSPIVDSSQESFKRTGGIMEERRKALHWLLGKHPIFSENDTST